MQGVIGVQILARSGRGRSRVTETGSQRREKHEARERETKRETWGGRTTGERRVGEGGRGAEGGAGDELSKLGGPGALITPCWAICE